MSHTVPSDEYCCFVGGLSWSTTDKGLENAFRPYGNVVDAKVILDRETGRSRGFGFVTFGDERSLHEAIDRLHMKEIDGRQISVNRAVPRSEMGGFERGYDSYSSGAGRGYGGGRGRGGGRGSGSTGDECYICGRLGHWARDCRAGGGDRFASWDRYGGGRGDRYYERDLDRGRFDDSYVGGRYDARYERYGDPYSNGDGYGRDVRTSGYRESARYDSGGPVRYKGGYRERSGPYSRPPPGRGGY